MIKYLFWIVVSIIGLLFLMNVFLEYYDESFFSDNPDLNTLYCNYEKYNMNIGCQNRQDCFDISSEEWSEKYVLGEWDNVVGEHIVFVNNESIWDLSNFINNCVECRDNICYSGIIIN